MRGRRQQKTKAPPCLGQSRAQGKRQFEKQLIPAITAAVLAARVEPQPQLRGRAAYGLPLIWQTNG
jgi:hypothetical protein